MMQAVFNILGLALMVLGSGLLLVAAWGVNTLPDALSRQHAATLAGTLGVFSICIGAALLQADWSWTWKLGLIITFLLLTMPVASHMLARAAVAQMDDE
ncbi:MAG: monovalent cation/H(+) antiporter subunit G [Brachymonas sp.]|nr:monovalent cation/H(+) antiporter subunit G [Brachymonas sp.]